MIATIAYLVQTISLTAVIDKAISLVAHLNGFTASTFGEYSLDFSDKKNSKYLALF